VAVFRGCAWALAGIESLLEFLFIRKAVLFPDIQTTYAFVFTDPTHSYLHIVLPGCRFEAWIGSQIGW
jgi:hypothetical protein